MKTLRSCLLVAAGCALLSPPRTAHAQVTRQRVDTAFAFDRGGSVSLSLVSGEIRVVAGTTNEIRISATVFQEGSPTMVFDAMNLGAWPK